MKHKLLSFLFLLLLPVIQSCNDNKSDFVTDGKVTIAGNIINYNKHPEFKKFNLYHHNLFELQKVETVEIDSNGNFNISFPCHYNMDFFIGINRTAAYLICQPDDSLFITIDADVLNNPGNKYPNGSYFLKVAGGTRINDNKFVNEFIHKCVKNNLSRKEYLKTVKTYNPFEFLEFQKIRYKSESAIADSLYKNNGLFNLWAKDFSKYEKIDKLLKYPKLHAKENNLNIDSLIIPPEYYNKVFDFGINDKSVISFYHNAFFISHYTYLYKQAKREKKDVLKYILANAKGFSKDIAVCNHFILSNKTSDNEINIDYNLINNDYLKNLLKQKIEQDTKKKKELLNLKAKSKIIDTLFGKYKGQVVYVDFWATWCAPCLKEIPFSVKLQKEFADKPVVFLFLCTQSNYKNWQKTVAERKIKGENIFLNKEQFDELRKLFDIKGVPHYMLINKQGKIINNAPRPSDKKIKQKILTLLKE